MSQLLETATAGVRAIPGLLARFDHARVLRPGQTSSRAAATTGIALPMVLHVRVADDCGDGHEIGILQGAGAANLGAMRVAAAFIHPRHGAGVEVVRSAAEGSGCALTQLTGASPLDPRTLRDLVGLCRELRVALWHAHDARSNLLGLAVRKLWPMKLVSTVHAEACGTSRTRLAEGVDHLCLPRYDHVIAASPSAYHACRRLGIRARRLSFSADGIDVRAWRRSRGTRAARYALGVHPDALVIGGVGRMSSESGFDRAIHTLDALRSEHPHAELHLFGDGPARDGLEALARDLGLEDAVVFWGRQSPMQPFYELMDVLLLPGYAGGLPCTAMEAMAMGVPVAAAPVAGVHDLLKGGHSGLILGGDPWDWPEALEPLLTEPAIRAKCVRRGRRRVEKHFSLQRRVERERAVYERLLTPRTAALAPAA